MKKKVVTGMILILFVVVILLGIARYKATEQRQIPHQQSTLVKVYEGFQKEREGYEQ